MKALKIILITLLVLVVVVIGGVVALVSFADPNDFKGLIADKVHEATGRTLTLEGPLEIGLWPKIRIAAGPLALSNAPGFGEEPFFAADDIRIAVATLPLLRNRLEMDTVVLHGLRANLARNAEGVTNWEDLTDPEADADDAGDGLAAIILGGVDVRDGALSYRDAVSGQVVVLSDIAASTGPLTFGEPVDFELTMNARANQPALDSDLKLAGTVSYNMDDEHYEIAPLALDMLLRGDHLPNGEARIEFGAVIDINGEAETVTVSNLQLTGLGTRLSGEFAARDIDDERPSAAGRLELEGRDLAIVFNAFELPVGKRLSAVDNRGFAFNFAFDADMDSGEVVLSEFDGNMLGATLKGQFNATDAHTDEPTARGSLSASGPDLPTLLAVVAQLQGADAATLESLDAALAGARDKSFAIAADLDADLGAGRAEVPKLEAQLLGNTITGQISAQNVDTSDELAAQGTLEASGPDLPALLAIASQFQADGAALREMGERLAQEEARAFDLELAFDTDLGAGRIALPTLAANLMGLEIRGTLAGSDVDFDDGQGELDGTLAVTSQDLGTLLRSAGQPDLAKSLRTLDLDLGVKGNLSDLTIAPFTLTTQVSSPELEEPVQLAIKAGSARANLDQDTLSLEDVSVTGLGLDARASLEASGIGGELAYRGTLAVPAFDLRKLLASLNQPVPKTADPKALTKVALNSNIAGSANSVKLDELRIVLDDTTVEGNVDVKSFAGPALSFSLGIDSLDADRYLEPTPPGQARAATPEAAAAGAASELPVEMLRALEIKGDLSIGNLVLSGAKLKDIKLAIDAEGGTIKLAPLAAQLYDGSYAGTITLDATGARTLLTLNTKLDGVNVEPLLEDTVDNDTLSGVVSFDAALKGTGGSAEQLQRTLTGDGRFKTVDGVFRGVDAVAVLRAVEQIIECKCPVEVPKGGETRFTSLGGTLNAQDGVVRNEDLVLAGDGFTITGKGMLANLHDNSVKYDLKLAVEQARQETASTSYNLGGYTVPIRCRGTLDEPSCLPDVGDILKQVVQGAAKKKIEQEVGDKIKDAIGGEAGEKLKDLFKF